MKRFACCIAIPVIFLLGIFFYAQKEHIQTSNTASNSIEFSASELIFQENEAVTSLTPTIRPARSQTSILQGFVLLLFLIYSATFFGLKIRSLSAILSLHLQFTVDYLLRLKIVYMQDGKKRTGITN